MSWVGFLVCFIFFLDSSMNWPSHLGTVSWSWSTVECLEPKETILLTTNLVGFLLFLVGWADNAGLGSVVGTLNLVEVILPNINSSNLGKIAVLAIVALLFSSSAISNAIEDNSFGGMYMMSSRLSSELGWTSPVCYFCSFLGVLREGRTLLAYLGGMKSKFARSILNSTFSSLASISWLKNSPKVTLTEKNLVCSVEEFFLTFSNNRPEINSAKLIFAPLSMAIIGLYF